MKYLTVWGDAPVGPVSRSKVPTALKATQHRHHLGLPVYRDYRAGLRGNERSSGGEGGQWASTVTKFFSLTTKVKPDNFKTIAADQAP